MQVGKEEQEKYATKDFQKIEWYFKDFCEIHESIGDERILDKCEDLSAVRKKLQSGSTKILGTTNSIGVTCNHQEKLGMIV